MKKEEILVHLREIEKSYNVKIIYACESGSRMWGFDSQDSDYDIRFIYVRSADWYLSPFNDVYTIEIFKDNMDIVGWDFKKAIQLIYNSNPSIIEWMNSPIVYIEPPNEFKNLVMKYVSYHSLMKHYYGLARKTYHEYVKSRGYVLAKKYLYTIRSILSAIWIHKNNTVPPINFNELLEESIIHDEERNVVHNIVEAKISSAETSIIKCSDVMTNFIEQFLDTPHVDSRATIKLSFDELNSFFINIVRSQDE